MRVDELTGAALDWAVAMAENWAGADFEIRPYSTDWAQGGPIIEREGISVWYRVGVNLTANIDGKYEQSVPYRQPHAQLTVAMRCYVASKLGDTIDIPEELK